MAAPKRTKLEREAMLVEIERWHNRGLSTWALAAKFGLSQPVIRRDLETITERYRTTQLIQRQEGVNQKLSQLREVRKEAWAAWEQSKENRERQVKEKINESLDKDGNPTKDTIQKMKAVITTEGQRPGNEFLATVLHTFEEEAKLLGLYAPTKNEFTGAGGAPLVLHIIEEVADDRGDSRANAGEAPPGTEGVPAQ